MEYQTWGDVEWKRENSRGRCQRDEVMMKLGDPTCCAASYETRGGDATGLRTWQCDED